MAQHPTEIDHLRITIRNGGSPVQDAADTRTRAGNSEDTAREFRKNLSSKLIAYSQLDAASERFLERFMRTEHPRDAWLKTLLSAMLCSSDFESQMMEKLIGTFPGILQRKLLRDAERGLPGYPALHTAVILGQTKIVELLTNWTVARENGPEVEELLTNLTVAIGSADCAWTPLHLAAASGDDKMVEALMKFYDQSPKQVAQQLEAGDFSDAFWMTPLHYAVLGNHEKVIEKFVNWKLYESHVNDFDFFMRTAFHMACSINKPSLVRVLLRIPTIDVNIKDCCHFTPLHWAVHVKATSTVQFLLSPPETGRLHRYINVTDEDVEGRQAFDIAVENDTWKLLMNLPELKPQMAALYRERQLFADSGNSMLVGSALIASVTFGGWLQPPLGDRQNPDDRAVRIFWVCNSLSFFFALATVTAAAGAVLPTEEGVCSIANSVRSIRRWISVTAVLLVLSVVFVLGAFAAAGFSSLTSVSNLKNNMVITTSVGTIVCSTVGWFVLLRLYGMRPKWLKTRFLYMQFVGFFGRMRKGLKGVPNWVLSCCGNSSKFSVNNGTDRTHFLRQLTNSFSRVEEDPMEALETIRTHLEESELDGRRELKNQWKDKKGVHGSNGPKMKLTFSCRSCAWKSEKLLCRRIQDEIKAAPENARREWKQYFDMWRDIENEIEGQPAEDIT